MKQYKKCNRMVVYVIGWFPCAIRWLNMQSDGWSTEVNQFGTVVIAMNCQLPGSKFNSCTELIYLILFFGLIKIHNSMPKDIYILNHMQAT